MRVLALMALLPVLPSIAAPVKMKVEVLTGQSQVKLSAPLAQLGTLAPSGKVGPLVETNPPDAQVFDETEFPYTLANGNLVVLLEYKPQQGPVEFTLSFRLKVGPNKDLDFEATGTIPISVRASKPATRAEPDTGTSARFWRLVGTLPVWLLVIVATLVSALAGVIVFSIYQLTKPFFRQRIGGFVSMWPTVWRRREETEELTEKTKEDLPIQNAKSVVVPILVEGAEALAIRARTDREDILKLLDETIRKNNESIEKRFALVHQIVGEDRDRRILAETVRPQAVSAVPESRSNWEEQALVASVNQWIRTGGMDRRELVALANGVGLSSQLMAHINVAKALADFPYVVYEFEPVEREAGWLWVELHNSGECLAVPADARAFHIGKGPAFLDLLVGGTQGGPENFKFERIYSACRLKRKGNANKYDLLSKGLLRLEGLPAPSAAAPTEYETLERKFASERGLTQVQPSLAALVASQFRVVAQRLEQIEASLARRLDASPSSDIAALRRELTALQNDVAGLTKVRQESTTDSTEFAKLKRDLHIHNVRIDRLEKWRSEEPREAPTAVRAESIMPNAQPQPTAILKPPVADSPPSSQLSAPSLPENWSDDLRACGGRDLSVGQHGHRLEDLRRCFEKKTEHQVRLVHLASSSNGFVPHLATFDATRGVICNVCQDEKTYQATVCVGELNDTATILILLPIGELSTSNYPAGFQKLIENVPSGRFMIHGVKSPAVLQPSGAEYLVRSKLIWDSPS